MTKKFPNVPATLEVGKNIRSITCSIESFIDKHGLTDYFGIINGLSNANLEAFHDNVDAVELTLRDSGRTYKIVSDQMYVAKAGRFRFDDEFRGL